MASKVESWRVSNAEFQGYVKEALKNIEDKLIEERVSHNQDLKSVHTRIDQEKENTFELLKTKASKSIEKVAWMSLGASLSIIGVFAVAMLSMRGITP